MPESLVAIIDALPYLLEGSLVTLIVVVGAMGVGFALGAPLAVGQVYGKAPVRWIVKTYVWFFRGVPLLVLKLEFLRGALSPGGPVTHDEDADGEEDHPQERR